jgi:hypothetical protein
LKAFSNLPKLSVLDVNQLIEYDDQTQLKESAQDVAPHKYFLVEHGRWTSFKTENHDWNLSQNGKSRCEAVKNKALVD